MCIVSHDCQPATADPRSPLCPAALLAPEQRRHLALQALTTDNLSQLARQQQVSRKFLYHLRDRANDALEQAFAPTTQPEQTVLFHLPVTPHWIRQFVLVAVLVGHASFRGAQEMLDCLLDFSISLGTVHNIVHAASTTATAHNATQDLAPVRVAALDEIFQNQQPVLAVVDVASTYCCALSLEDHRDADTWAVRLLELQDQGFAPKATVADFGTGLRAGCALALPAVPCRGDVFHAEYDLGQVVRFLDNRAYAALTASDKLGRKRKADVAHQQAARQEYERAVALADDVSTLARWLREDVLGVAGPCLAERQELYDFIVAELRLREPQCEHRLRPARVMLSERRETLLLFAAELDQDIATLAARAEVAASVVRELLAVQEMPPRSGRRWRRDQELHALLGRRYHELSVAVAALRRGVVRASSLVENLNSRLRNYFHLRREVGGDYLELLRFFLNHRVLLRSERAERQGHSPAELLSGAAHGHWLELLGYQRFQNAA